MFIIPNDILHRYAAVLRRNGVVGSAVADYKKWLRYYFDFCDKYPLPEANNERVLLFSEKLRQKKQNEQQRHQAAHAVSLYFEVQNHVESESPPNVPSPHQEAEMIREPAAQWSSPGVPERHKWQQTRVSRGSSHYCEAGYEENTDSPEWDEVLAALAGEIKVRHYSRKTLKTYALWSRQFQRFLKNKPPRELSTADVKEYLTHLAVKCNVAASTQNQAFNSLLFLFRHALKREFGELRGVPRAKKSVL